MGGRRQIGNFFWFDFACFDDNAAVIYFFLPRMPFYLNVFFPGVIPLSVCFDSVTQGGGHSFLSHFAVLNLLAFFFVGPSTFRPAMLPVTVHTGARATG